jgi:hypothetical protein
MRLIHAERLQLTEMLRFAAQAKASQPSDGAL